MQEGESFLQKQARGFKQSGNVNDKGNFECAKLLLKNVINNKKKLSFEEKIGKNKNNPKEVRRNLKPLGMPSKRERQSKITLKENALVCFN